MTAKIHPSKEKPWGDEKGEFSKGRISKINDGAQAAESKKKSRFHTSIRVHKLGEETGPRGEVKKKNEKKKI